jgi:hypothetical protein
MEDLRQFSAQNQKKLKMQLPVFGTIAEMHQPYHSAQKMTVLLDHRLNEKTLEDILSLKP